MRTIVPVKKENIVEDVKNFLDTIEYEEGIDEFQLTLTVSGQYDEVTSEKHHLFLNNILDRE